MAETTLEMLLLGHGSAAGPGGRCRVIVSTPLHFNLVKLNDAMNRLPAGDIVAYAVPLDAAPLPRLLMLATLRVRLRRAARLIARRGAPAVMRLGIDPHLEAPTFAYQLDSAASRYADGFLRPRGSAAPWRRLAARCFGCDPGVGAVVVMGKKS